VSSRAEDSTERYRLGDSDVVVAHPERFAAAAADLLAEALRARASEKPGEAPVSLALSGGSTPRPVYERLARAPGVPWSRVGIYFADERAVPPDDARSNYWLVRESLLDLLSEPAGAVHRMEAELADLDEAAARYERLLPDPIDALVLGVGEDGHTASLFPGSTHLEEGPRRIVVAQSPLAPRMRLTITPRVIRTAGRVFVLVRGAAKAKAVALALSGPADPNACPAQLARGGLWILDTTAAGSLRH
jgi:6-phosphogluconolactonase